MKTAFNNAISITTATPGCWVKVPDEDRSFPVIAWALVARGDNDHGSTETTVQPVFLFEGETYTTSEWYQDMGPERGVKVVYAP